MLCAMGRDLQVSLFFLPAFIAICSIRLPFLLLLLLLLPFLCSPRTLRSDNFLSSAFLAVVASVRRTYVTCSGTPPTGLPGRDATRAQLRVNLVLLQWTRGAVAFYFLLPA